MKKYILLIMGFAFSLTMIAQGNSNAGKEGKGKSKNEKSSSKKEKKQKDKEIKAKNEEHDKKIWDGTSDKKSKGPKSSKNQPAKVREAFQRDYPNASNVTWSKYRGDWAATFGNVSGTSTAVYHANGERRDTRTPVTRNEIPGNVLDSIFKKRPGPWLQDAVKIQVPNILGSIYRIKNNLQGEPGYYYYNSNGQLIKYDY